MAVSYDVVTTSTTAEVTFYRMWADGYSSDKSIYVYLGNRLVENVDVDFTWVTDWTYTYTGLDSDTYYDFSIDVYTDEGDGWRFRYTVSGDFTTESGGGGGGDDPYFAAEGDGSAGTIYVEVINSREIPSSARFYFTIDSGSYNDWYYGIADYKTFTGVPSGTYTVRAVYEYNGRDYTIYASNGRDDYITVELDGGGGGSWTLEPIRIGYVSDSFDYPHEGSTSIQAEHLYRMELSFTRDAEVTFSSLGSADMVGWLSDYDQTTWGNNSSGWPDINVPDDYLIRDDDSGTGSNFSMEYSCVAYHTYYLWYRTYGGSAYSDRVTISVSMESAPSQQWNYTSITGIFDISGVETKRAYYDSTGTPKAGEFFPVSFSNNVNVTISVPSSEDVDLFVTDGNYSYDTSTGYPFDSRGSPATESSTHTFDATSGQYYYVWVKGHSASAYGSVTVTIAPEDQPSSWTRVFMGDVNVSDSTRSEPLTIRAYETYAYRVKFSIAGVPRIYSTGNVDVIAYFSDTNYSINPDTGVPVVSAGGSMKTWDDASSSNRNFDSDTATEQNKPNVMAGDWYYLWVKVYSASYATGPIVIYFVPPTPAPTGTNIWIYTGSGSSSGYARVARCWEFNGSSWVQVTKPWLYTNTWE